MRTMLSTKFFARTLVFVILVPAAFAAPSRADEPGRRLVFNDDAQGLAEAPFDAAEAFMRKWISREMDLFPMTTFTYLVACPDLCLHDSKVGEVNGDRFGKRIPGNSWARGIRGLRAQGTDVLKVAIGEARAHKLEVLAAIRMSDTHYQNLNPSNNLVPQFAIDHPQYVIKQPDGRTDEVALDYSYPEVRKHRLAIMRELAEDYDIDGLELNFVRWAKHFPNDQGRQKAPIMTAFIGRVREVLDAAAAKRGRDRLTLGVVVPEGMAECWLAGCDPETWVKRGWIDYLTISTFNESDPQLRVDEFARFTRGTRCQLLVNMGNMMGGVWKGLPNVQGRGIAQFRDNYSGMLLTTAEARVCAANYYAWGADGISFWNLACNMGKEGKFTGDEQIQHMKEWTHAVASPESAQAGERCYHYLPLWKTPGFPRKNYPFRGKNQSALGTMKTQIIEFKPETIGRRQVYRFRMADGRGGEKLRGNLRFWVYYLGEDAKMEVDVNGTPVDPAKIRRAPAGQFRSGLPGVRFDIALADCPPFCGDNELGLTLKTPSSSKAVPVPYMEELEVQVE